MLDRLLLKAEKTAQIAVWIGGGLLIFAAVLTTIARVLDMALTEDGADEIAGYMFAISTAFAFAYATLHRAHVRIDALYIRVPARLRTALDVLGFLMLGGFLGVMAERAFDVWWNSVLNSSVSITPLVTKLAWPQGFWFAGILFFVLVFCLILARIVTALFARDWLRIAQLVGPRGVEEEVKEERDHALAELARERAIIEKARRDVRGGDS